MFAVVHVQDTQRFSRGRAIVGLAAARSHYLLFFRMVTGGHGGVRRWRVGCSFRWYYITMTRIVNARVSFSFQSAAALWSGHLDSDLLLSKPTCLVLRWRVLSIQTGQCKIALQYFARRSGRCKKSPVLAAPDDY